MSDVDVLIIGSGPTGLTLACELARSGLSFRILEASAGPQPGSRGKGIQPRTLEVFDNLGIIDRVVATGQMAMPTRSIDAEGHETISGGAPQKPLLGIPYPATLITPEWRIEEALRDRLSELGGGVSFGTELVGIEQSDEGAVATVMGSGGPRAIAARWLVGCDGGRSTVRHCAGISFLGETMEAIRMIVADVRADGIDRDHWHMWRHAEGFFALCPLPSTDEFQLQASVTSGQDPALTLANMQSLLEHRTGQRGIRIREFSWSSLWRANIRMVDRYREKRVFLAGDAAHVHSPAGGQGMNTGIQDAHNLGWKLAAVLRGASPGLLDTYQAERLPVAAAVLALSNDLLQQIVRERGIVVERNEQTKQLGINYRTSSLSRDDRQEGALLRAGDRAPDAKSLATIEGERRLFDLMRGGHATLLLFGHHGPFAEALSSLTAVPLRVFHVVEKLGQAADLVDTQGELAALYRPSAGTAVLIRPDGYLALIAEENGVTAVQAYLASLLSTGVAISTDLFEPEVRC
jgi:2-polyprenyl-6-methoxyphenol hydroxylase-like FAD-dependent oxidoreductase